MFVIFRFTYTSYHKGHIVSCLDVIFYVESFSKVWKDLRFFLDTSINFFLTLDIL